MNDRRIGHRTIAQLIDLRRPPPRPTAGKASRPVAGKALDAIRFLASKGGSATQQAICRRLFGRAGGVGAGASASVLNDLFVRRLVVFRLCDVVELTALGKAAAAR